MIDMKCPSCGAGGRITREKVGVRLVCKKCLRVFHVNANGQSLLGEPSAAKKVAKPQAHHVAAGHDKVERFDRAATKLSSVSLPRIDLRIVGVIAVIALISGLGYLIFSKQSLEKRAQAVAKSFVKADMTTAVQLSAPGTEMDTIQWYSATFQQYNELKLAFGGQDAGVTITPRAADSGGTTEVDLVFSKEGLRFDGSIFSDMIHPNPSRANTKQTLDVPLFWTKDFWGNWLLDGTKTFASRPAA